MSTDWTDASDDLQLLAWGSGGWDDDGLELEPAPPRPDSDSLEQRQAEQYDQILEGFKERSDIEARRSAEATFADHYVVIVFASRAQKDAYVRAKHWQLLGQGERYIDGRDIARTEGIELPPDPEFEKRGRSATWDHMAMTVEENRALPEDEGR